MSRVMEKAMKNIGVKMIEEGRRRDRGDSEIEERLCRLEERMADKGRDRGGEEKRREERIREMERTLEDGKVFFNFFLFTTFIRIHWYTVPPTFQFTVWEDGGGRKG